MTHSFLSKLLTRRKLPNGIEPHQDILRLLLARSLYQMEYYDKAKYVYQSITKGSNHLAQALSELAWTYLKMGEYDGAVGTAINLQSGGLKSTFAPEATLVLGMSMNELCQYPEAARAVDHFKRNYESTYKWLQSKRNSKNLYKEAIQYLSETKKSEVKVPERIVSEWIRSPLFISRQEELNELFKIKNTAIELINSGKNQQRSTAVALLKFAKDLNHRYRLARVNLKPGESLPHTIQKDLQPLKNDFMT